MRWENLTSRPPTGSAKRVKPPEKAIAQANATVPEVKVAAQQALAAASAPQIEGEIVRDRRALR